MKEKLQKIEVMRDSDFTLSKYVQVTTSSIKRMALYEKFKSEIFHNPSLDRTLVSFQANKQAPFSAWFKYREGFSERLVTYLIQNLKPQTGILLDPFSGGGSALFAANELGWQTKGIELLPVGIFATKARLIAQKINVDAFNTVIAEIKKKSTLKITMTNAMHSSTFQLPREHFLQ